jgi:hypothetical protein
MTSGGRIERVRWRPNVGTAASMVTVGAVIGLFLVSR